MADDNKTSEIAQAMADARDDGYEDGLEAGRLEILDWLQAAYIADEGRPDRGSPKGEAILELARDAAAHFKPLVGSAIPKKVKRGKR